jgi:hypothetical protein
MEALPSDEEIDQQYRKNIDTLQEKLGISCMSSPLPALLSGPG